MNRSFVFLAAMVSVSQVSASVRPNILWITSEDHGTEMGCYGDLNASTPNIDALAGKGMLFKRVWSTSPVCAPARTAIISGMYPSSTGSEHMRSMVPMPSGSAMYPQFLRDIGYYCTNNSKKDYNLMEPKGVWDESSQNAHWRYRSDGQPFFAIFNSVKSHESQIRRRPHNQVLDPAKVRVPAFHPDTPEVRKDWAQYYDIVSLADADAGAVLREIEEAGLLEETIIFYYGDHGTGMPRGKRWPCNLGLQVPMVVFFPEKFRHLAPDEYIPGGKSDRMVSFVDLAPTVLSIAGIRPPDWMQGNAFAGPYQAKPPDYLHGLRGRMDECQDLVRSVTDGRYVYIRNYMPNVSQGQFVSYQFETPTTSIWREWFDTGKTNEAQSIFWKTPKDPEELYDLMNDPDEVHNLARLPEYAGILKKLRKVQQKHALEILDVGFLPEGEIHSRSGKTSPYDMAREKGRYPMKRIFKAAELASSLDKGALPELMKLLKDKDSAVRYWAVLGILMRGEQAVYFTNTSLYNVLIDESPYVRMIAAQALAQYGNNEDIQQAISVLGELAPPGKNGVFVSMYALMAIRDIGSKSMPLMTILRQMSTEGGSPDSRYDSYVKILVGVILESL